MSTAQDVHRRTLQRNIASKSGGFRAWAGNDQDFASSVAHSLDGKSLTFSRAEAVEGNLEGVPSDCFDFCQQVWVSVLSVEITSVLVVDKRGLVKPSRRRPHQHPSF